MDCGSGGSVKAVRAFLLRGLLSTLLFGVPPTDLILYASASALIVAAAAAATLIPAMRASHIDPGITLRDE